jgi:cysteine-rich repeat protein
VLEVMEQCDDGNLTNGDGCSSTCTYELIPGNSVASTDNVACLLEWAIVNPGNLPRLDRRGRLNSTQSCKNGDPTCDLGSDPAACEFHVAVCVNNVDPQLPLCVPQGIRAEVDVRFGGIDILLPVVSRDPANYNSLYQALQQFRDSNTDTTLSLPIPSSRTNVCTDEFMIRVPLRTVGTRQYLGSVQLRTLTGAQDTSPIPFMRDLDGLRLVCKP